MKARGVAGRIRAALDRSPVVIVEGARAVGKSTACAAIAQERGFGSVVDLADAATRAAARRDPSGFLNQLTTPAMIDEVQRVPELTVAIKGAVERPGSDGQFLLTGSARLARDGLGGSDPLAGRAITVPVYPFSLSERWQAAPALQRLFEGRLPEPCNWRPGMSELQRTVPLRVCVPYVR
ncbi:MAG: AAA family ATPase [Acidimicrobiia bacterium]